MDKKISNSTISGDSRRKKYPRASVSKISQITSRVLNGELSLRKAVKEYNYHRRTITKWVDDERVRRASSIESAIEKRTLTLRMKKQINPSEDSQTVKSLTKALEKEKLRSAAYLEMIKVAEQQFKIKIRKKAGAKQLKGCVQNTQK